MKLASSEVEAEADRWGAGEEDDVANEEGASVDERGTAAKAHEDNDIVRRAKNMSGMALSMYEFTKGDGGSSLRTTQDLFTQAEYLAEEANRLYKLVRQFSYQVQHGVRWVIIINCSSVGGGRGERTVWYEFVNLVNYRLKYVMFTSVLLIQHNALRSNNYYNDFWAIKSLKLNKYNCRYNDTHLWF